MRELKGPVGIAVAVWSAIAVLFQLYTAYIGYLEPREQRSLHLLWFLPLIFLLYPATKSSPKSRPSIIDGVLAVLAIAPNLYSYLEAERINLRLEGVDPVLTAEVVFGTIATVLVIEALRRAVTPVLAGLLGIIIAFLFTTEYLPGFFNYRDIPYPEIVEWMYLVNGAGMFGTITGISATMVAIFIAFGAFVEGTGMGRLFNNLGARVAGRQAGGPAKVATITSCLFGTMSGSSAANVFATGSFTIPMMKKLGYRPSFAGGVEAAASVGGQIMPPIMGAGAFVMAEITNIPYSQIIVAALLGAICYFFMIFIQVHLEARKNALKSLDESEIPSWKEIIKDLHLVVPVAVLMILLTMRFSPHFAAFYSILCSLAVSFLRRHTRLGPVALFNLLARAGANIAGVAVACVGAGMIVTGLTATGLVVSFGSLVTAISGDSLIIAGAVLAVTTLLMGMGVPTTAAYVITSSIGAPILISEFGVPVLAAHLFVFYFSILADATPPVSIASFAAASIAKSNPIYTGVEAFRLAAAGFLIGFSYLFTPSLMLQGPWDEILGQILINLGGLLALAAAFTGYLSSPLPRLVRLILLVVGPTLAMLEIYPVWPRVLILAVILGVASAAPRWSEHLFRRSSVNPRRELM